MAAAGWGGVLFVAVAGAAVVVLAGVGAVFSGCFAEAGAGFVEAEAAVVVVVGVGAGDELDTLPPVFFVFAVEEAAAVVVAAAAVVGAEDAAGLAGGALFCWGTTVWGAFFFLF